MLELARIFSRLYKSSKTQPSVNLVFLLSAGGKFNYFGTKRWLESHLDSSSSSELLSDVKFCLCLDSIGNIPTFSKLVAQEKSEESSSQKDNKNDNLEERTLYMHVSKPPKEDSHSSRFFSSLQSVARKMTMKTNLKETKGKANIDVRVVHKKINLAEERLAWEHESFSIRRLPAFTLSNVEAHDTLDKIPTILDRTMDNELIGNFLISYNALIQTIDLFYF